MAIKPGICQNRLTVVALSPHRYCVITYIMSQVPAHYVVLALSVQLVLSLVSVSLPLSSRLCLGQRCYDSANQPESSHWFVIITPLEGFGGGSSSCRSATHRGWREKQETGGMRRRLCWLSRCICLFFTSEVTNSYTTKRKYGLLTLCSFE